MTAIPSFNHEALGMAAALMSAAAFVAYLYSILIGRTQPSRVTWWVHGFLNAGIAASYYAAGARSTIWLPVEFSVSFLAIGLLSIKYGEGGWTRLDGGCLLGAVVGLGAWWLFRSSELGLVLLTIVDLLGLTPTFAKVWSRPWTEDRLAWFIGTGASMLNVLAIDRWTLWISAYPLYVLASNVLILILFMRTRPEAQRNAA